MDLLKSIVVFLLGVGAAMGAYATGAMQNVPDFFGQYWTTPSSPIVTEPVVNQPIVTQPVVQPVVTPVVQNQPYPTNDRPNEDDRSYRDSRSDQPYGDDQRDDSPYAESNGSESYPGTKEIVPVPVPVETNGVPAAIGYAHVRLKVRCNVRPREIPYGCAAAYGVVNRTGNQVVIAFEDPRGRGGPDAIAVVRPGEALAGEPYRGPGNGPYYSDLRRRERHFSHFKPGGRNAPAFIIELKDCGVNDPKCGTLY